ncbi:hypothetical protein N658DRAFT_331964 [Parathielavia hyrcaniae]|uniref:Uncharacterized protein n=1 Tax=Parathielavia hyrcaniae TaxID=113614 RepID=A0AAN6SXV8_9PEZI|nr:hypothetical protein N658DRAFT_331964 [Parathielavia hyrcaniae]
MLAAMTARAEEVQKQYPSADLKLEQKWWVPSVDFGLLMLQNDLPVEIRAKINVLFAKLIQHKFAPEIVTEARQGLRELLQAEHSDVMERVDEAFFVKHEAQFAEFHRQLQAVGPLPVGCFGGEPSTGSGNA